MIRNSLAHEPLPVYGDGLNVRGCCGDEAIAEGLISFVEDRRGHDRRCGIVLDKIREEIGWEPETAFEDGIVRTIRRYLDNQE